MRRALRPLDLADTYQAQRLLNSFMIEAINEQNDITRVYWLAGQVGVKSSATDKARTWLENIEPEKTYTAIFVKFGYNCVLTPPARKDLILLPAIVEFFDSNELLVNMKLNELQPKMSVLLPKEAEEVKDMYGANDEQFPKLSWDDPIRRYFGAQIGQIIRFKRLAENGVDPMYRIVEKKKEKHAAE
jgi:DNA-directed RNA polymerase subunit H (RpoH/RPB5)